METITLSAVYLQVVCNFSTLSRVLGEGVGVVVGVGGTLSPLKKALAFNNVNRGP